MILSLRSARSPLASSLLAGSLLAGAVLGATPAQAAPVQPAPAGVASVPAAAPRVAVVAPTVATVRRTATTVATIRASAAADGVALGTLEAGQRIPTTAPATEGWVPVRFRSAVAYVAVAELSDPRSPEPSRPQHLSPAGTTIATGRLVVRSGPTKSATAVSRLAEGTALRLTGPQRGGYVPTTVAKRQRWVSVRYLASQASAQTALDFARAQLGKPYSFGAAGPKAFDCSGLTQASWRAAEVALPRTAAQQALSGTPVAKSELQPGDLVFFYGSTPTHVALYVGDDLVIHSPRPGQVVQYIKMSYMPYSKARRQA